MFDELLPYYSDELIYLRQLGAEFAARHPDKARELRLGGTAAAYPDPHVERLIEGVAFLTARVRQKIDDDFPEISTSLLEILCPHYLAPSPAKSIVRFELAPGQEGLTTGFHIPQGSSLATSAQDHDTCSFQTCYPVTVFPIRVSGVVFHKKAFAAPARPELPRPCGTLLLELQCQAPDITFAQLEIGRLRIMLDAEAVHLYDLYELLFHNTTDIAVLTKPTGEPMRLDPTAIQPVGFARDEGLLPYNPRAIMGYRILYDYFVFPQKYHFFDVEIPPAIRRTLPNTIYLAFNINRVAPDLEAKIGPDAFKLGCAPIVNLYSTRIEPVLDAGTHTEYRVVPDARRPLSTEIYSIDGVTVTPPGEAPLEYVPFYSFHHGDEPGRRRRFWHATRRPAVPTADSADRGTEVFLTLVDLDFNPESASQATIHIDATCLNRDLPATLPFGGGEPQFVLDRGGPVTIECLVKPTPTLRPQLGRPDLWRLISHLSLNHLSLTGRQEGAAALREILTLYDIDLSHAHKIAAIRSVESHPTVARVGGGFGRGKQIIIDLDPEGFPNHDLFFFTSVLERFLGVYCSLNSFTQLVAPNRKGEVKRWPPRAGEKALL